MTGIRGGSSKLGFWALLSCVIVLFAAALWLSCSKTPSSNDYCGSSSVVIGPNQKCQGDSVVCKDSSFVMVGGKCVKAPTDSTITPPDSTITPPDSTVTPPDSTIPPPPDSTVTPPDSALPPPISGKYSVKVSSAGTGATGAGEYPQYAMVTITAGTPQSGFKFKEWTSSAAGVIFVPGADNPNVMFSMPASAVTATAVFEKIPVAVKYAVTVSSDGNGATGGGEYSQNDTVTVTAGTPPTGQQFKEWISSVTGVTFTPSANNATVKFIMPASAVTATAKFEPIPAVAHTITFNAGSGAEVSPANRATDTTGRLASLPTPTKNGYEFVGWFTIADAAGGTMVTAGAEGTVFKADTVIYARWTLTNYTITYNLDSGTVATPANPTSYTIATATFKLKNPTRTGYTFTGWTGSNGTTKDTSVSIAKGSTGDKAYTANWTIITYTITYNLDSGTVATANPASYTVATADFKLKNPTRTGYTFAGWTGSNGTTKDTSVSITKGSTGNKNYTANWTAVSYTITYTLGGGTVATANPATYNVGTATITLNNPTKNGYTFAGWTGTNGTTPQTSVSIAKGSTGNKNYTANWTAISYTITYTLGGGTVATANPDNYTIETETFLLNNPTRAGHTFLGWTGSNGPDLDTFVVIFKGTTTGNKTYSANWGAIPTYMLMLARNPTDGGRAFVSGGTAVTKTGITAGTVVNISATPEEGYTFTNWTITPSGNGEMMGVGGAENMSGLVKVNGDVTVTANFTKTP